MHLKVGTLVPSTTKMLLVTNTDKEKHFNVLLGLDIPMYDWWLLFDDQDYILLQVGAILEESMKMQVDAGYPVLSSHRLNIVSRTCQSGTMFCVLQKESDNVSKLISEGYQFIDVRTQGEYEANSAKNAINIPLNEIYKHLNEMDRLVNKYW